MFHHRPSENYLDRLTEATLRTPEPASRALLAYPMPRTYWRDALYSTSRPVLYVVRPGWLSEQAANLARNRPGTQVAVFGDAGHALFVDDAARFNALLAGFIAPDRVAMNDVMGFACRSGTPWNIVGWVEHSETHRSP